MYENKWYTIRRSGSHEDGWCFYDKKGTGCFMIIADEDYMMRNYNAV